MATIEWTFLLMNAFPGRGQTFVDKVISKVFPASSAGGFQTVSNGDSPELPSSLRIQWLNMAREERLVMASRVMLLRFHVKLLLALILLMILFTVFIFVAPFAFFAILSCIVFYILILCSYTAIASWLIITETSIIVAVPSWKYRWLAHLNLVVPRFAACFTSPADRYTFHKYQGRLISRIETPTFDDGSCKLQIDYKSGMHVMTDSVIMDHFVNAASVRSALTRLDHQVANQDLEAGGDAADQSPQYPPSSRSPSIPSHIADEIRSKEFGLSKED